MRKKHIIWGIVSIQVIITLFTFLVIGLLWPVIPAAADKVQIESAAAVLMEMDSGKILYEKNEQETFYPASIVKLLTALVVAERCSLDGTVIFSYEAVYGVDSDSGNPLQLEAGDKLTVKDCLYAMLLQSSNQAANALAEYTAGSIDGFAEFMNEEAAALGCSVSHFVNPSGLNNENQKVTAGEMAWIARAALLNSTVREIASADQYTLPATLNNPEGCTIEMEHQLVNDTKKQYSYDAAYAGKTGYTAAAGNTLATMAEKNGRKLLAVILKSEMTHYEDTIKLFDYGFKMQADNSETLKNASNTSNLTAVSDTENRNFSASMSEYTDEGMHRNVDKETSAESSSKDGAGNPFVFVGAVTCIFLVIFYFVHLSVKRRRRRTRRSGL